MSLQTEQYRPRLACELSRTDDCNSYLLLQGCVKLSKRHYLIYFSEKDRLKYETTL